MDGTQAIYLGRPVNKNYFRAFVYAANGNKKLVESWDNFEKEMASGLWFATIEEALESSRLKKSEISEIEEETIIPQVIKRPKKKSKLEE